MSVLKLVKLTLALLSAKLPVTGSVTTPAVWPGEPPRLTHRWLRNCWWRRRAESAARPQARLPPPARRLSPVSSRSPSLCPASSCWLPGSCTCVPCPDRGRRAADPQAHCGPRCCKPPSPPLNPRRCSAESDTAADVPCFLRGDTERGRKQAMSGAGLLRLGGAGG